MSYFYNSGLVAGLLHKPLTNGVNNGNVSPTQSSCSSLHSVPRVTVTDLHNPEQLAVTVSELQDLSVGIGGQDSPCTAFTPSPDGQFKKNVPEYSSFRIMKQKVSMCFTERNLSFFVIYCCICKFFLHKMASYLLFISCILAVKFYQSAISDGIKISCQ
jgi:hypothetical protein